MERSEAIEWLKARKEHYEMDDNENCQKLAKALQMAIDSLEVDEAYQIEYEKVKENNVSLRELLSKFHNDNADDVFIYDQNHEYLDCGLGCSSRWLDDEVLDIHLVPNKIIVIVQDD